MKRAIIKFFSHPVLGISASLASLVAIPMSFYFYRASVALPKLNYYVHSVRATVVKAGTGSAISVEYDGKRVATDITVAQVAIWNSGKLPIRRSDVLAPLTLRTQGDVPILEASVQRVSRDVTHLVLDSATASRGTVGITFEIMEQDDGCVVQLVYSGSADVPIILTGAVVGQKSPTQLRFVGSISSPAEQYQQAKRDRRISALTLVIMSLLSFATLLLPRVIGSSPRLQSNRAFVYANRILLVVGIVALSMGLFSFFSAEPPEPPFGFG